MSFNKDTANFISIKPEPSNVQGDKSGVQACHSRDKRSRMPEFLDCADSAGKTQYTETYI